MKLVLSCLRCLNLRDNSFGTKIIGFKDGKQQKLILMISMSKSGIFNLFILNNNGRWQTKGNVGNVTRKTITNKHGFHLFRPSHIVCGCNFDGEMVGYVNGNQIISRIGYRCSVNDGGGGCGLGGREGHRHKRKEKKNVA